MACLLTVNYSYTEVLTHSTSEYQNITLFGCRVIAEAISYVRS